MMKYIYNNGEKTLGPKYPPIYICCEVNRKKLWAQRDESSMDMNIFPSTLTENCQFPAGSNSGL